MEKEAYMQEGIDCKRLVLILIRKLWIMIMITIAGAALGAMIYYIYTSITNGEAKYVVESDYYITFNDKEYPNGVDYYNAYTWDNILRDDPIVDEAMLILANSISKDELKAAVTGEMLGDYRILTVKVITNDPQKSQMISDAYTDSLNKFASKIDMLTNIELWSQENPLLLRQNTRMGNAAILGGLIAAIISIVIFMIFYILDDSVYVERDFTKRYSIPFLGVVTDKKDENFLQECKNNYEYICGTDKNYYFVQVAMSKTIENPSVPMLMERLQGTGKQLFLDQKSFELIRNSDGVILLIPYAATNGKMLEKIIDDLKKQDCQIKGAIMTDAADSFLRQYYIGRRNK